MCLYLDRKCKTEMPDRKLYFTLTFVIMYAIPILVMVFTYSIIMWTLMKRKGPGAKGASSVDRARNKVRLEHSSNTPVVT